MWLPLGSSSSIGFDTACELAVALSPGAGFGFALERAGFGSARKLTAVCCLHDMAVVKVMSSAIAAGATGRKDAWSLALGLLAGVWAYAEFTPGLETWIEAGQAGELTLPSLSGIGMGWRLLLFVAVLALGARGMGWLERHFVHWAPAR